MNEKLEPWNDPKVEALVVAAILGEASDFEMAEVERLCQEHPEMALFFERMRNLHRYLDEIHDREEKEEDAWQLPKDKREALLNKIQTESEPTSRPVHQSNQSQGRKKSRRRVRALMMVAACLVVTMFTALLFIPAGEPALYESETKLQVLVSASDIDPFAANGRQQGLAKSKEFLPTEFKKITSEENLLRVVDRLDLKTRWGIDRQSAMEILKGATDLNADSDSDVVGIKVRHGNAEDARDIANEIANQYVERRKALEAGRAEKSLLAIDSELREQQDRVEEKRRLLDQMMRGTKTIYFDGKANSGNYGQLQESMAGREDLALHEEKKQRDILETQIASLSSVQDEELIRMAAGFDLPNNGVTELYRGYTEQKDQLTRIQNSGMGNSHPDVVALKKTVNQTKNQLNESTVALRSVLQTQLDLSEKRLARMEESVTKTKDEALQDSLKAGDFYRAKQDYEEEQKLLAAMRLKHSTQRISLKLPRDLTEVQEYAKLSKKPVKRKSVLATLGSKISEKKALVLESPAIVAYNAGEEKGALAAAAEESSVVSGGSDLNGVLPSPAGVLMAQREKAAAPSASMPRGIASSAPSPSSTPVPEVEGAVASGSFGNVDSFATGFSYAREGDASQLATAGMRSGDAAIQSEDLDAILNTPSSRLRKTKAAGEKRDKQTADPFGDVASDSESYDELGGDVDAFAGQAITRTNSLAFKKEQLQGQLSEKPAEEFRAANEILNEELAEHDAIPAPPALQAAPSTGRRLNDQWSSSLGGGSEQKKNQAQLGALTGETFKRPSDRQNRSLGVTDSKFAKDSPVAPAKPVGLATIAEPAVRLDEKSVRDVAGAVINGVKGAAPAREELRQLGDQLDTSGGEVEGQEEVRRRYEALKIQVDRDEKAKEEANKEVIKKAKQQQLEKEESSAADEPFSTFSLNVSDVSFKLAAAALEKGTIPEEVRVEDFVNAFDYGDPQTTQEEKVSCVLEQAAHPFMQQRNLVRVSMKTAALGRDAAPLSLTILLDQSGSMEREDRRASVSRAFELLLAQLKPTDEVTLIAFAREPRLLADRVTGLNGEMAAQLLEKINHLPSEGGTNLEEVLKLGFQKAKASRKDRPQSASRIILMTDGAANLGDASPESLATVVEKMRDQKISFDACGVGAEGFNDSVLENLTREGDGRYYFLNEAKDADEGFAAQIAGALRPAARNVKVQVEWNEDRVNHYRLYGFKKHRLKKEDFRNDSVDAAEMAAAEEGNALYHVQVKPDGVGDLGSVSVRFQDLATGQMVEKRWTIPYDPAVPEVEETTTSMRTAAVAGLFGEALAGGPVGDRVELKELAQFTNTLPSKTEELARLKRMIQQFRALK